MALGKERQRIVVTDSETRSMEIEIEEAKKHEMDLIRADCKREDEVIELAKDADAVLVDMAPITRRVIETLKKCKVIVRYGIGYDNIDLGAATDAYIYVANLPGYCIDEVSSHAVALTLAASKKLFQYSRDVKAGVWDIEKQLPMIDLRASRVGVVGLGNIGRAYARKMRTFSDDIVAYDPFIKQKDIADTGIKMLALEELLRTSDIISLHIPVTEETRNMFGERQLKIMKSTAFLINTARGAIVDENALYEALKAGIIAGAGLDALIVEEPNSKNPLFELDNVIVTPHVAFYSKTALRNMHRMAVQTAIKVLMGEIPDNVLNRNEILLRRGAKK
ncbi:MAG: C-terminal binding protein [Spirochaetia bacterium]|jgi:D-3-phosphoglycerate dehydrogenase